MPESISSAPKACKYLVSSRTSDRHGGPAPDAAPPRAPTEARFGGSLLVSKPGSFLASAEAPASGYELPVRVVKMKESRQMGGSWATGVAAIAAPLVFAQETDGHGFPGCGFAKLLSSANAARHEHCDLQR
jgi:hypothetical protein